MERPALKKLLDAVRARRIDVIVVRADRDQFIARDFVSMGHKGVPTLS